MYFKNFERGAVEKEPGILTFFRQGLIPEAPAKQKAAGTPAEQRNNRAATDSLRLLPFCLLYRSAEIPQLLTHCLPLFRGSVQQPESVPAASLPGFHRKAVRYRCSY
ncbi:MAG: hypothetical protein HFG00_11825 [Oscillibacter sp.]|nr:hypothetical protein [Oscillibacter sp.]